jgi:hypothetical protein
MPVHEPAFPFGLRLFESSSLCPAQCAFFGPMDVVDAADPAGVQRTHAFAPAFVLRFVDVVRALTPSFTGAARLHTGMIPA